MLPIPQNLITLYNSLLIQKAIPETYQPYYRKWLRYYLDFCQKYGFRPSDTKRLRPFINKLKEKKPYYPAPKKTKAVKEKTFTPLVLWSIS